LAVNWANCFFVGTVFGGSWVGVGCQPSNFGKELILSHATVATNAKLTRHLSQLPEGHVFEVIVKSIA
jgi:hypothetical protein